jgi:hypothetical protein
MPRMSIVIIRPRNSDCRHYPFVQLLHFRMWEQPVLTPLQNLLSTSRSRGGSYPGTVSRRTESSFQIAPDLTVEPVAPQSP